MFGRSWLMKKIKMKKIHEKEKKTKKEEAEEKNHILTRIR